MSSLRTFVAICLSDRLKKSLKGLTKGIQASNPLVHWVPEENLHLTLCFLGDVELNQFPQSRRNRTGKLPGYWLFLN